MPKTLREIADHIGGELSGKGDLLITGINGIDEAKDGDIALIISSKYREKLGSTRASCVVAPKDVDGSFKVPLIKVSDPSLAFSKIIKFIFPEIVPHPKGLHETAIISKSASIGKGAAIGPYVVVGPGASIGDDTVVYPFSYIGNGTRIGSSCVIYANVTVRECVVIGNRVIIHSGTVVGSDGFGYDTKRDGTHAKIPQLGTVVIEDDVELGACVTVDRARFSKTIIGKGSKIDNLVQIAHNVKVGPNCIIAAQTGISGSSELGRNVTLGGQVGIADHLKMGDFSVAGAKSGITKSFPANTTVFWYPAKPAEKARDVIASVGLLPKLFERVRVLENKIKELESGKAKDD